MKTADEFVLRMSDNKIKVLLEMRPALDGFSGISQETRLLFRGLCMLASVEVTGMLQMSHKYLMKRSRRVPTGTTSESTAATINTQSRIVIAASDVETTKEKVFEHIYRNAEFFRLVLSCLSGINVTIRQTRFESKHFRDFLWRYLFDKSLPAEDFGLVTGQDYQICPVPWNMMHNVARTIRRYRSISRYPRLDTEDADVFIAQTPYPAIIGRRSVFVVRYHDAIPILMPHTIKDKRRHQSNYYHGLQNCVAQDAYFACVSDATRTELLNMFPELVERAVTIYNMVPTDYFIEAGAATRVSCIVRNWLYDDSDCLPKFRSTGDKNVFYERHLASRPINYLLMVSTIEPRKNHLRLLAAWEVIKSGVDPALKLVIVGKLGWDNSRVLSRFKPWIEQGQLFMLNGVPSSDLRVLYRHATATVCPSLGEGFDYSGVEAMCCGSVVIASDIPVHREIYGEAATYFDCYSTAGLVSAIESVSYGQDVQRLRQSFIERGKLVSSRYSPENILPVWDHWLQHIVATRNHQDRRGSN